MRKLTLATALLLVLIGALPAAAKITDTGKILDHDPHFLSGKFTSTGVEQLVVPNYDEDNPYGEGSPCSYQILDINFQPIKTVIIPSYPSVESSYTVQYPLYGPTGVTETYRSNQIMYEGDSIATVRIYAMEQGMTIEEKHGDEYWFLSSTDWDYYEYRFYGRQYPMRFWIYRPSNLTCYEEIREYQATGEGLIGWSEAEIIEDDEDVELVEIQPYSSGSSDMFYMMLTQTLFNNDDLYEWLIPILKPVAVDYESEDVRIKGNKCMIIGYQVVSENGNVVAEIKFPTGYAADNDGVDLYIMSDGGLYLLTYIHKIGEENYGDSALVYRIDRETGSVKQIGEPLKIGVSPTAPRRGTPVTVDLSAEKGECMVEVVAADGRVVARKMNCSGRTTIETSVLASGLYVVNVVNGQNRREATKIVVR